MAVLEEDVRRSVMMVLPSFPEDKLQSLLVKLASIGVESKYDLHLIKEEDLTEIITPIQCRRLLNVWQTEEVTMTLTSVEPSEIFYDATPEHPPSESASSSPSLSSSSSSRKSVSLRTWPEDFEVPWNRMPAGVRSAIAEEKRPSAKDRRAMVRLIVDEMRMTELNPSKAQCLTVAKSIVQQYPQSFADIMRDGTVIGSGYGSLLTQLKTRVEHVNRGNTLSRQRVKRRVSTSSADIARGPADQYGCVRWQPDCPPGETEESLKEKQGEMKDLFQTEGPAGAERGSLSQLMKTTYYLQRKHINASPPPSIAELKNEWPYLFTLKELFSHFKILTDISILDKMAQAVEEKGKVILRFFQQKPTGTNTDEVENILLKYNEEKCDPFPAIILLLMAHFRETPESLILQADTLATPADVERTLRIPDSPRLIVLGEVLTANDWMLTIEGQVVLPPNTNFVAGMAALFSSYYNFNLVYQEQASCTLEFIQRCFLGINPSRGTKTERQVGQKSGKVQEKRNNTVNLRVSSLLRRLMDFEWLSA
ncbi:uncharacterized protein LOC121655942 [Melanotaenia boesemani]|uniref:uncharacterized protein LOC121655942 n=1 Tax=Melanotaenia boesemani TaxID=1250792 RepID=UPI001C056E62|nr:uncharacterized protein LOC121655942 [Melanotaenia boesemani]